MCCKLLKLINLGFTYVLDIRVCLRSRPAFASVLTTKKIEKISEIRVLLINEKY